MSKRKIIETGNTVTAPRADSALGDDVVLMAVSRRWLFGLAALVIVPWLFVGAIYSWGLIKRADGATTIPAVPATGLDSPAPGGSQPWGQLEITPIVISPPLDYVPTNWGPIESPQWRFPGTNLQQLEQFLLAVGLDREQVSQLLSATRTEPRIDGLIVSPDTDLVRKLNPKVRAAIYLQLARTPLNERQKSAYRHFAPSIEAWLGGPNSPRAYTQLVEPFAYRLGDFLYFADIDLVRSGIEAADLQRLAKRLLRESTMLVRLRVNDARQIDAIAEYWGRGGRRTDIRPLLESIAAGSNQSIDISYLVPTMMRVHLYRYPQISLKDLEKPSLVNCFWTALNFFNMEPDDRFLDLKFAVERLKSDYYIVHDQFQLGDVAVFTDSDGNYFHAAVYLAGDLVFGKNGTSPLSPWTIVPTERLKGYYVEQADDWNVTYYRRKGM